MSTVALYFKMETLEINNKSQKKIRINMLSLKKCHSSSIIHIIYSTRFLSFSFFLVFLGHFFILEQLDLPYHHHFMLLLILSLTANKNLWTHKTILTFDIF